MTPEGERLVRETFPMLERASVEAARVFYQRLFTLDPAARALFDGVDMEAQGRKFVAMLGSIVRSLDRAPRLVADVAALGRRHAGYGAGAEHFASVGAALVWTVQVMLGPACTPEVRTAWTEAYSLIAAVMRRAAESRAPEGYSAAVSGETAR